MKNLAFVVFIILIVLVLALYLICFQVRETESALVTRFGKTQRVILKPGLGIKWPAPIERLYKFDSRWRVLDADLNETTTKGAVPIIVNTYVVWKIADPLAFFNALGTVREAKLKLLNQISDSQNRVIGQHAFGEFVNSDKSKIKFQEIEEQMRQELTKALGDDYGIKVNRLGIKQLNINKDVSKDVFARMRAERNRRTQATIAQGNALANTIQSDVDAKRTELLAAAEAKAKAIKGQGDAEAAQFYKMLREDPQLAMFLRDIEALKKTLEKRSTIVLSADTEPFKLLKRLPDISPKDPNKISD